MSKPLATNVDALLRQREEAFTLAEDERIEAVRRYEAAEAQLAAFQARCAELEEALKDVVPFVASWLEETYLDEYTKHASWIKVQQALTERPPA